MSNRPPPLTRCQLDRRLRRIELMLRWVLGLVCGCFEQEPLDLRRPPTGPRGFRRWLAFLWSWGCGRDWLEAHLRAHGRAIAMIVICRANLGRPRRAPAAGRRPFSVTPGFVRTRRRGAAVRSVIGSALRRRLRARSIAARLQALFAALRDIEALIAAMRRRIARQLTRLAAILPARPPNDTILAGPACEPALADSS